MSDSPKDFPISDDTFVRTMPPDAMDDEEKILAGNPDVNYPALLTRDVQGG